MKEMKVSDLHLKKELTQIRKAARVLRDPGTTSSWKSPLNSSRSVISNQVVVDIENEVPPQLDSHFNNAAKEKRVFLHNWRSQRSSSEKNGVVAGNDGRSEDEDQSESCSVHGSSDDTMSDARNHGDLKSKTYLGETRSASMLFRFRDANMVSSSTKRVLVGGSKKKSKKNNTHLDVLSRYEQKESNLRRLLKSHSPLPTGAERDDSSEQSDDTVEYSYSEEFRKLAADSPYVLKPRTRDWAQSSTKLLTTSRKEDSSCTYSTPALSTSSFNMYYNRNPSNVGSWDATTISLNDEDDEIDDHLDLTARQGCGIPCYWSKRTPRHRGLCRNCCSPSISDTLRRKGSSMLCGGQSINCRCQRPLSVSNKEKIASRSAQGILPLLRDNAYRGGRSSIGSVHCDDELSVNVEELDLEALSKLDGTRWSSSCSQNGLDIVAMNAEGEEEGTSETIQSLSQKYRPVFFSELIGQNIVIQSLVNSISTGRIAPVYLFQGPRGTGKTATARIFASALNCTSTEEMKPCGSCRQCSFFISGNTRALWEVDATNKKGIDKIRYLLRKVLQGLQLGGPHYKVFLIDECHLLPLKMWLAFLKFLEEPPQQVVFIFTTTDPDNVPRTVQSRCQKFLFNKIRDCDIVERLKKISNEENLDVELDALDLIALNADGSFQDAETMLEQLSLLGKKITASLVNELVGVVSDEKLLELLELAMSSDTGETVKRARDLMDAGVDPLALMSQLASLIMDIIAGTYNIADTKYGDSFISGQSLTEMELERLKHALKLLSDAEKQLRVSSDRSTWFTATLLQLGSVASSSLAQSSRYSSRTSGENRTSTLREVSFYKQKLDAQSLSRRSSLSSSLHRIMDGNYSHQRELIHKVKSPLMLVRNRNSDKLDDIWSKCIKGCHSKTLKQLLLAHGKLLSISESEGILIVYVAFDNEDIKARANGFLSSITSSIEMVLQHNVEVKIINLASEVALVCANQLQVDGQRRLDLVTGSNRRVNCSDVLNGFSNKYLQEGSVKVRGSFHDFEGTLRDPNTKVSCEASAESTSVRDARQEMPIKRIESVIREQRLETAWLQAVEKGTPRSSSRLRLEKNQVHPQEEDINPNLKESQGLFEISSQQFGDELNHELKVPKVEVQRVMHNEHIDNKADQNPISPSILHDSHFVGNSYKQVQGYESSTGGRGCCPVFCLNIGKHHRRKGKRTAIQRRCRGGQCLLFGHRVRHRKNENKSRKAE